MANLTLNEHLMEVLEKITDESVKGDELKETIHRADAAARLSQQIIANNNFELKVALAAIDRGVKVPEAKSRLKLLAE